MTKDEQEEELIFALSMAIWREITIFFAANGRTKHSLYMVLVAMAAVFARFGE